MLQPEEKIAQTPQPPYYAVVFTSVRTEGDQGYAEMAHKMEILAASQPGYLGFESARSGLGVSVSYWDSVDAIAAWKKEMEHAAAQETGKKKWYAAYKVRICKVERDYEFNNI